MKKIIALSLTFAILGLCILVGTAYFCLTSLNGNAIMVKTPEAAQLCSENLMSAIENGDFQTASGYLYGQVDLGVNREPAGQLGARLWNAFEDSITYEFIGDCYATSTGAARDVWITTLDPASVNSHLSQRAEELAETMDTEAEDFMDQLLLDALEEALKKDATTVTRKIQLNLVYQNGQWWVVPDAALIQAISGGVAG